MLYLNLGANLYCLIHRLIYNSRSSNCGAGLILWICVTFVLHYRPQVLDRVPDVGKAGVERREAKTHDVWVPKVANYAVLIYKRLHDGIGVRMYEANLAATVCLVGRGAQRDTLAPALLLNDTALLLSLQKVCDPIL